MNKETVTLEVHDAVCAELAAYKRVADAAREFVNAEDVLSRPDLADEPALEQAQNRERSALAKLVLLRELAALPAGTEGDKQP